MGNIKDMFNDSVQYAKEHRGDLVGVIVAIPPAIFLLVWGDEMNPLLATIISLAIAIIAFFIVMLLLGFLKHKPAVNTTHVVLVVFIGLTILFGYSNVRRGLEIQILEENLLDSHATQAAQEATRVSMQATIDYQAAQLAALVPKTEIKSIDDLPVCNFEEGNFPCRHWTKQDETYASIAKDAYKNVIYAGRIAELYRDEEGKIPVFRSDRLIIIPDPNQPQDENYYDYYFGLLDHPIPRCTEPTFGFPCWRVSDGESYAVMADFYPLPIDLECIQKANKTEWNQELGRLDPKNPQAGTVFVLPSCP